MRTISWICWIRKKLVNWIMRYRFPCFMLFLFAALLIIFFLFEGHLSCINAQRDTVLFHQMTQDCLFIRGSRIFPERPHAAVSIAANVMARIKLNHRQGNHVQNLSASPPPASVPPFFSFCFCLSLFPPVFCKADMLCFQAQKSTKLFV